MRLAQYHKDAIFRAIKADLKPPVSVSFDEFQEAVVKAMSADARKLYRTSKNGLRSEYMYPHEGVGLPGSSGRTIYVGDADVKALKAQFSKPHNEFSAAMTRLRQAIDGFSTVKQFKEAYPDLAKYAPSEPGRPTTGFALAVVDVTKDLVKYGFKAKAAA